MFQATIDDVVFNFLEKQVSSLSDQFKADIITIFSPMTEGTDVKVRQYIEDIGDSASRNRSDPKKNLVVILETQGGSVEVVERIANVFRDKYENVKFIVPGFAYSAGTVLVLSGDEIYMDDFSVLGPIDPQIINNEGIYLPATGYLHQYNRLMEEINVKISNNENCAAQINHLSRSFQPEKLAFIEQNIQFSKNLISDWLVKYKFKDWNYSESENCEISEDYKKKRANEIATILGDVNRWHTHGRGINLKELTNSDIHLKINNFAQNEELNSVIRMYYDVLKDYLLRTSSVYAIYGSNKLVRL